MATQYSDLPEGAQVVTPGVDIPQPIQSVMTNRQAGDIGGVPVTGTLSPEELQSHVRPPAQFSDLPAGAEVVSVGQDQPKSIGQQAKETATDLAKGFGEGALQTVHGVGEGVRQFMNAGSNLAGGDRIGMGNLGDKIVPPEGQAAMNQIATPANTTQQIGSGAEALLEMMAGDGILKGMSLAERLTLGSKIAKMAEDYPVLGKILIHGLNATRAGTAQAGVGIVKGQPIGEALASGAETAAIGTGVGALAEGAGKLYSHMFNPETGMVSRLARNAAKDASMEQKPAQIATRTAAGQQGSSVRELLTSSIEREKTIAQSGYAKVEEATGINLKGEQQKLANTIDKLNELGGTEADLAEEAKLEHARTTLMDSIAEAKQQAISKGVITDSEMKAADAAWTKHKALSEVHAEVFDSEGVIKGNTAHGTPETINVDAAISKLEKLNNKVKYGESRLVQAFGKNGADRLLKDMYAAQREGIKGMTVTKWEKIARAAVGHAVKGAIYSGIGAGGYEAYKALTE